MDDELIAGFALVVDYFPLNHASSVADRYLVFQSFFLSVLLHTLKNESIMIIEVQQQATQFQIGGRYMRLIDSFTPDELAQELGVTKGTLATWRSSKPRRGPEFHRIAGRIHYMRTDVEQWIQEQIAAA